MPAAPLKVVFMKPPSY
uniref:Uncharacterized protein n=1 Tax=Anguilla anguilla TaxID=7936 RepID=A0A0E9SR34_ANGAN